VAGEDYAHVICLEDRSAKVVDLCGRSTGAVKGAVRLARTFRSVESGRPSPSYGPSDLPSVRPTSVARRPDHQRWTLDRAAVCSGAHDAARASVELNPTRVESHGNRVETLEPQKAVGRRGPPVVATGRSGWPSPSDDRSGGLPGVRLGLEARELIGLGVARGESPAGWRGRRQRSRARLPATTGGTRTGRPGRRARRG